MLKIPDKDTYRVDAWREYGIAKIRWRVVGYYRWYWQANMASFLVHHLRGFSCNTWRKSTKPATPKEKVKQNE